MSPSPVLRILIVDDDPEWLGLLTRLFPGHVVDAVQSFEEALRRVEAPGQHYDVAIIDLNLLNDGDRLGGDILMWLHANSPSTQRIAVTGTPEGSMRRDVLDEYHVEDVFIKRGRLVRLRQIVLGPPSPPEPGTSADSAPERLRAQLRERIRALKTAVLGGLNQKIADQQNDLLCPDCQHPARERAALEAQLGRMRSQREAFVRECADVEALLEGMGDTEDGEAAARAVRALTARWES